MSVELIKKPINVYRTMDEQQKEELMETGMIVSDSKPDVMEVLAVDTDIVIKTREKTGRVMEVGGDICYQVLYRADNQNQSLEAIQVKAPWSISCNYPASEEELHPLVNGSVEHTDVEIVNGRKLSAKSVVNLNIKYLSADSIEAGEALSGEQVYQRADTQEITMLEDIGDRTVHVAENVELPEGKPVIEEIMYQHGAIKDVQVQENMNAEGVLELDFVYRADNDNMDIENVHMEIPITQNLEIENYNDEEATVNANIKYLSVKPDEDMDGLLTRVKIDAEVEVGYILYAKENVHLVNDAYAMDYDFTLEKETVVAGVEEKDIQDHLQVTGNLSLECDGETLEDILCLTVKPRLLSAEQEGDGIEINGCLDIFILYGTGIQMRVIRGSNQEMQFNHRIPLADTEASYEYDIVLTQEGCSYEIISDTEMDMKAQVGVKAHISKKQQLDVVTDVKDIRPAETKENPPLLVYYARQGDNLWNIAKRYRVPVQKIMDDNGMTEEVEPDEGQKLLFIG